MKILIQCFSKPLKHGKENPKNYPYWETLIDGMYIAGYDVIQIGSSQEKKMCEHFVKDANFAQLMELLKDCDLFICVDSFLQHMAHYYGKKGIVLFGPSDPSLFGYKENVNLYNEPSRFRENQYDIWENAVFDAQAFVTPDVVLNVLSRWNK